MRSLSVNIDHVATLRNARGTRYPDVLVALSLCELGGADGVTVHLREDRRHIQDRDLDLISASKILPLHLEMAATDEMLSIALDIKPDMITLVPEKREELTTEGGLDIRNNFAFLRDYIKPFRDSGIKVSLFVEADGANMELAKDMGVDCIELHTGTYCDSILCSDKELEFNRLKEASIFAKSLGLLVNAGHGIYYDNIRHLALIKEVDQFSIGHGIISRSIFVGLKEAVREMKSLILRK